MPSQGSALGHYDDDFLRRGARNSVRSTPHRGHTGKPVGAGANTPCLTNAATLFHSICRTHQHSDVCTTVAFVGYNFSEENSLPL